MTNGGDDLGHDASALRATVESDAEICPWPEATKMVACVARAATCRCAEAVLARIHDLLVSLGNELALERAAAEGLPELVEFVQQVRLVVRAQATVLLMQRSAWNSHVFPHRTQVAEALFAALQNLSEASAHLAQAQGLGESKLCRGRDGGVEKQIREAAAATGRPVLTLSALLEPALSGSQVRHYKSNLQALQSICPVHRGRK